MKKLTHQETYYCNNKRTGLKQLKNTINMLLQRHRTNSCDNMKQLLHHEIYTATSQKAVLPQHQLKTYCNIKKPLQHGEIDPRELTETLATVASRRSRGRRGGGGRGGGGQMRWREEA
jgi:hypothetical protein